MNIPSAKSFIYVGNFRDVKGTDILLNAFKIYKNKFAGKWELICVGNGPMQNILQNNKGIKVFPFSSSRDLIKISAEASVFILPSRNDMWGVVVQEFCCLEKGIILSENVGAKSYFLIDGFNGVTFRNNSSLDLAKKMKFMSSLSNFELSKMQLNSKLLSNKMSPVTSAANFMSVLNN